MKKTLAAVAVLGAFAGSAIAADVTLYGIVDMGLNYSHVDADGYKNMDDMDKFEMKSGQQSGSRWGLKGTEDLGNGLTVGFILEDGFTADDGAEAGQMFDRESSLFIEGGFGKLAFGRMGSINNGVSSWGLIGRTSAFGTSFGDYTVQAGNIFSCAGKWDNMIAYQTPSFAGFKVYAQYSMGNTYGDADAVENESSANRYYAIGATYDNGPFGAYLAVDSTNYKSWDGVKATDTDDSLTVTLGGSYDFEVAKVYLGAQYFDEVAISSVGGILGKVSDFEKTGSKIKGYSVALSADAPILGGKGMFGVGYLDAEQADSVTGGDFDFTRWVVSAGYDYPLSKRTNVYGIVSYMDDDYDAAGDAADVNPSAYTFLVGMRHKF